MLTGRLDTGPNLDRPLQSPTATGTATPSPTVTPSVTSEHVAVLASPGHFH